MFEYDAKLYIMFSSTSRKTHKAILLYFQTKLFSLFYTIVKIVKPNNGKNK